MHLARCLRVLLLTAPLSGCGAERELSGVWRQTACEDGLARDDCSGFVYELHIGRYGDQIAGMVVRYVYDRSGFGNFQRPRECGCYFIEGGRATDESLQFRLFDTGTPRYPQPDTADRDLACTRPELLTTCEGRQFVLEGDGDELTGYTDCNGTGAQPITFERVVGQTRTECHARIGGEP